MSDISATPSANGSDFINFSNRGIALPFLYNLFYLTWMYRFNIKSDMFTVHFYSLFHQKCTISLCVTNLQFYFMKWSSNFFEITII